MKLKLVSKEVAILAKELGFDEVCNNLLTLQEESRKISMIGTFNSDTEMTNMLCTLPEQELLAEWLRDIHEIWVEIQMTTCKKGNDTVISYKYSIKVIQDFNPKILTIDDEFPAYEKALEAGLLGALDLLKRIKR